MRRGRRGASAAGGAHAAGVLVLVVGVLGPVSSDAGMEAAGSETALEAAVSSLAAEPVPDHAGSSVGVPVLLVPGWLDTERDLAALRVRLLAAGWADDHVAAITFDDPAGSNRRHADELAKAIGGLRRAAAASEVDVVAHSMGGLALRWYLMKHDDPPVRRVVFLASPHRGTIAAHLAWGGGRDEMTPGSPFLDTLNTVEPAPTAVEALTIRTAVDTHIVPGESATLPNVPDHEVCCPTHSGLIRDDEVFAVLRAFLAKP